MRTNRIQNRMNPIDALYDAPFMREVLTRYHPIGLKISEKQESPIGLTGHQFVVLGAFRRATKMISSIERLFEVPAYVARFPNNTAFAKAEITRIKPR